MLKSIFILGFFAVPRRQGKADSCKSLAYSVLVRARASWLTQRDLKRLWPFRWWHASARKALGSGLAVLLFLSLQLLAVSPHLHHEVHPDSHQPDHQCAVKLLSDGQVDVAADFVVVAVPTSDFTAPLPAESVFLPAADHQFPPGRAPPFLSA